jgi:membrane-associated phospholipid phosphatase
MPQFVTLIDGQYPSVTGVAARKPKYLRYRHFGRLSGLPSPRPGDAVLMAKRLRRWTAERHLSAADERFGLRLGAGVVVTPIAAVTFVLLLLLVRAGWPPLRDLDAGTAEALNQIGTAHPELVKSAEVVSDVFDPNVFRVALTLIALVYLIHGERHHATWLVVTVFGGAALGFALKVIVGRARPVLPDPLSAAPGMSFPSGHALGASIGCCLLLLIALRFLPRGGRVAAVIAAALIVGSVALARVVLGVHFVSDVLAGITLGVGWVAVTTWAYVAWRRETGQAVERPADVGTPEHPVAQR